jgi:pimeloyl-ACP methyl ester carboxylesterase
MKLVFVHGAGNTGRVWYYQTKYFPDSDAVTLPNRSGDKPFASIEQYAEWLHDYIQGRGYQKPVIIGHSMGGAIAQRYALDYPDELSGLVLIATGARLRVRPDFLQAMENALDASPEEARKLVEPFYSTVPEEVREMIVNDVVSIGVAARLNGFRCCDRFDVMDKVHLIKVPTLVISGTEDVMTPLKYARYLVDKIEGARLVVIEGATHFVFLERPEEVNRAIDEFVHSLKR